jgi:uncharacterized protein YjiS (DUF1127 family)
VKLMSLPRCSRRGFWETFLHTLNEKVSCVRRRAITTFTKVYFPKGQSAVGALNHPAAIGSGISHAPISVRFDITDARGDTKHGARSGSATSRRRESFARRLCGRLVSAAIARVRVMRVMPADRGVASLSSHQLRDIGLADFDFETSSARSIGLLMLYAGHGLPRPHVVPSRRIRLPARTAKTFPALRRALRTLSRWRERIRGRRQLAGLDGRALRDISLSWYDVQREARKPFWRA